MRIQFNSVAYKNIKRFLIYNFNDVDVLKESLGTLFKYWGVNLCRLHEKSKSAHAYDRHIIELHINVLNFLVFFLYTNALRTRV